MFTYDESSIYAFEDGSPLFDDDIPMTEINKLTKKKMKKLDENANDGVLLKVPHKKNKQVWAAFDWLKRDEREV